uniref:Uncharacterized protein n=1 Tax=Arundo donax TaxID=35708 RepID=A0A0A9D0M1_ARUDO
MVFSNSCIFGMVPKLLYHSSLEHRFHCQSILLLELVLAQLQWGLEYPNLAVHLMAYSSVKQPHHLILVDYHASCIASDQELELNFANSNHGHYQNSHVVLSYKVMLHQIQQR